MIKEEKFRDTKEGFREFSREVKKATIAIESTGFTIPAYDFLEKKGYEVKIDAKMLADLLRSDLLPTSYVPSKDIRKIKEMVRFRTSLKNKIHSELAKRWIKPEKKIG